MMRRLVPTCERIIADALIEGLTLDELLDSGPGRLQGNHPRPVANAVAYLAEHGCALRETGDVEAPAGHVAMVDRWLVRTDEQGFVSVIEYDTIESAGCAYRDLEHEFSAWSLDLA